jgi:hypothetical protein
MNRFKGYVYVLFSLLVLIAAAVLVIGNLGTMCKDLWVYSKVYNDVSVGGLMLASAGGGIVTVLMLWLLILGVKAFHRARKEAAAVAQEAPQTAANPPPQAP